MPTGVYARPYTNAVCHPERKHRSKGLCASCYTKSVRKPETVKKYYKEYYKANQDKIRQRSLKYYRENPELIANYRRLHPEIARKSTLRYTGWTLDRYNLVFLEQKGVCAICGRTQKHNLSSDHDHITKQPRGLLCKACNSAIGLLQDNSIIAQSAVDYLKRFGK